MNRRWMRFTADFMLPIIFPTVGFFQPVVTLALATAHHNRSIFDLGEFGIMSSRVAMPFYRIVRVFPIKNAWGYQTNNVIRDAPRRFFRICHAPEGVKIEMPRKVGLLTLAFHLSVGMMIITPNGVMPLPRDILFWNRIADHDNSHRPLRTWFSIKLLLLHFLFYVLFRHTGEPRQSVPADSICLWPVLSFPFQQALWVRLNLQYESLVYHRLIWIFRSESALFTL